MSLGTLLGVVFGMGLVGGAITSATDNFGAFIAIGSLMIVVVGTLASAVVRSLVSRGVDPVRLVAAGYDYTRPKAPNRDDVGQLIPENQSENRRVKIEIER